MLEAKQHLKTARIAVRFPGCFCERKGQDDYSEGEVKKSMNPIFERASVRAWSEEPIEKEQIEQLMKAAMASPSAVNARPWTFYCVTNAEVKKQLSESSPYSRFAAQAPLIVAVILDRNANCAEYNEIDAGICIENILLESVELGLGGVCLGVMPLAERMKAVKEILKLAENEECAALLAIGKPKKTPVAKETWQPERVHYID